MHELSDTLRRALTGAHTVILPSKRNGRIHVAPLHNFDAGDTARAAPAVVVHTSGSTGQPKAVGLSAQALRASAAATEALLDGPGRWYLTLPTNHIAGVQVLLRALQAGTQTFQSKGPFRAETFASDVSAMRTSSLHGPGHLPMYTSLVPTQLARIMDSPRAVAAARIFDTILLGGAAVSPNLLERAADAGLQIVRTYGMSETGGGCVYNGVSFPGVNINIEPDGRVRITGNVVADGYVRITRSGHDSFITALSDEQAPGFSFLATHPVQPSAEPSQRSFLSSDLGRLDNGVLSIVGRADDVFISGGENITPLSVENAFLGLLEPYGATEVLIVPIPDPEWGQVACLLIRPSAGGFSLAGHTYTSGAEVPAPKIRALSKVALGSGRISIPPGGIPRRIFVVDEIPLKGIGKPDRIRALAMVKDFFSKHVSKM